MIYNLEMHMAVNITNHLRSPRLLQLHRGGTCPGFDAL